MMVFFNPELAYFFLCLAWVRAEAATLFSALVDFGLLKIFPALLATLRDVCSFRCLTIMAPLLKNAEHQ
jgi:hypothetical protein